jgi:hypothetical protein
MSNVERKPKASVSVIWSDAMLDGEPARVSIVNGTARIRIGWFDIHVPGKFDSDVDEVIAAYERQVEETEKAFRKLPDDWEQSSCCDDLLAITDEELEREIREFEKHRGQVINIKTRQSI